MADYMRQPPRFVPTLTEVVQMPPAAPAGSDAVAETPVPAAPLEPVMDACLVPQHGDIRPLALTAEQTEAVAERLSARLMQRVECLLEERLRYALADMVQLQTQALVMQLRRDVESVVRQSVDDAMAEELSRSGGQTLLKNG